MIWLRRLLWLAAVAAGVAALLVVALTLAYTVVTPVSTLMLARWVQGEDAARTAVSFGDVSPELPLAVLTSEDQRFCEHRGVDWDALRTVIEQADEEGPARGASTITMQLAKNLFLWPSRSAIRKGLEIPLALWLDLVLSKRRQMEIYLNIAEWAPGTFGAEAAAQRHFRKGAKALTRREAALLAASLPNPIRRNAGRPGPGLRALAGRLQGRMGRSGEVVRCLAG